MKKKIIYALGALTLVTTPVIAVVSCGGQTGGNNESASRASNPQKAQSFDEEGIKDFVDSLRVYSVQKLPSVFKKEVTIENLWNKVFGLNSLPSAMDNVKVSNLVLTDHDDRGVLQVHFELAYGNKTIEIDKTIDNMQDAQAAHVQAIKDEIYKTNSYVFHTAYGFQAPESDTLHHITMSTWQDNLEIFVGHPIARKNIDISNYVVATGWDFAKFSKYYPGMTLENVEFATFHQDNASSTRFLTNQDGGTAAHHHFSDYTRFYPPQGGG